MKRFILGSALLFSSVAMYADMPIECDSGTYSDNKLLRENCSTMVAATAEVIKYDMKNFGEAVAKGEAALNNAKGSSGSASTQSTTSEPITAPPEMTAPAAPAPAPVAPAAPSAPSSGYKW